MVISLILDPLLVRIELKAEETDLSGDTLRRGSLRLEHLDHLCFVNASLGVREGEDLRKELCKSDGESNSCSFTTAA